MYSPSMSCICVLGSSHTSWVCTGQLANAHMQMCAITCSICVLGSSHKAWVYSDHPANASTKHVMDLCPRVISYIMGLPRSSCKCAHANVCIDSSICVLGSSHKSWVCSGHPANAPMHMYAMTSSLNLTGSSMGVLTSAS